jgi:hypothetical protein
MFAFRSSNIVSSCRILSAGNSRSAACFRGPFQVCAIYEVAHIESVTGTLVMCTPPFRYTKLPNMLLPTRQVRLLW